MILGMKATAWGGLAMAVLQAATALGCSCRAPDPSCAYVERASAVFVGTPVYTNDDPKKGFVQGTLYKFEVREVFKGLPEETREVWIDPGSYTSCYANYELGRELLVFAYRLEVTRNDSAAMTVAEHSPEEKPPPPGFDPNTPVYLAPECSGTRDAASAREDIEWLREWRAGRTRTRISGTVVDSFFEEPLRDVAIIANSGAKGYATKTDAEGKWSFDNVPAGRYQLTAELANYRAGFTDLIEVKARTCATSRLWMEGSGAIPVRVVDAQGRPVSGVELDIARVEEGKLQFGPYERNKSREDGRFVFAKLPAGNYVAGVNIRFGPSADLPYESIYLPGEHSIKEARVIHLGAGEIAAPVRLKLLPKIGLRTVRVQVRDLEGRKVGKGVGVFANGSNDAATESAQTDGTGVAELRCLTAKSYQIEAQMWLNNPEPGEGQKAISEPVRIESGEAAISLDVKMTKIEEETLGALE
jgi:hypothetical protein